MLKQRHKKLKKKIPQLKLLSCYTRFLNYAIVRVNCTSPTYFFLFYGISNGPLTRWIFKFWKHCYVRKTKECHHY